MWILISLILISIFFFPNISITSSLHLRPEDFIIGLIGIIILVKDYPNIDLPKTPYTPIIIAYLSWMIISVVLNNNILVLSSIFEILKFLKIIIVFIAIYRYYPENKANFEKLIIICFWCLVAINLFQFFDPFNLNSKIWDLYISPIGLQILLDDHRVYGLIGNCNINGVLFIIFIAYFLSRFYYYKVDFYKALIAAIIVLLTQSRTDLLALVLIVPCIEIAVRQFDLKRLLKVVLLPLVCFIFLAIILKLDYISSLLTLPVGENKSIQLRLFVWDMIHSEIVKSPILGSGGDKAYLYLQGIVSENQYVLITFLFGFVGLLIFLVFLCYPFYYFHKNKNSYSLVPAICSVCFIVTSFTNAPLNDYRIFLFAITFIAISCLETDRINLSKLENNDESLMKEK